MEKIEKNLVTEKLMCVKLGKEVVDDILTMQRKLVGLFQGEEMI